MWLLSAASTFGQTFFELFAAETYPGYYDLPLFDPSIPLFVDLVALAIIPLGIAITVALIGAGVRRMHDTGHSGWFMLVPFYNIYLLLRSSQQAPNRWG